MFSFFKHQNHNKRKWKLQKKFLRRNIWTQCGTFEKNSGSRSCLWLWFWLWFWLWSWSGLEGAEATQGVEFRALWLQSSPCSPDRCCQSTRPRLIWCLGDRELSWPRWWIQRIWAKASCSFTRENKGDNPFRMNYFGTCLRLILIH